MKYGENSLEIILTPCSLLLIMLDRSRLSQLGLVIFNLFRLDRYRLSQLGLVLLNLFRLDLVILHDRYHHNSHYNTYS